MGSCRPPAILFGQSSMFRSNCGLSFQTGLVRFHNTYDCGIFTCQYARCLATTCQMIPKTEVPTYRLLMIQELYQKRLCPIPPPTIQPGQYYAVDYIKNYCFGRVIDKNDSFVQFKFLHRVDATTYH